MRSLETTSDDLETNVGEFPEVTATAGGCSDCWKLRRVGGEVHNMTENVLSNLIVIFSVQLQQTKNSDRKLFIFHHGQPSLLV